MWAVKFQTYSQSIFTTDMTPNSEIINNDLDTEVKEFNLEKMHIYLSWNKFQNTFALQGTPTDYIIYFFLHNQIYFEFLMFIQCWHQIM